MLRNRYGIFIPIALGVLVLALILIAANTTPTRRSAMSSGGGNSTSPNSTVVQSSSATAHSSKNAGSSGGSADLADPSNTGSLVACSGSLSQAQLQTKALAEGQARHTLVKPFGCVTVYKIKPGDSLWDLAKTFAVHGAYLTLYQWNQSVVGRDPNLIHPGQVVIVDPTGKVSAPQ